MCKPWTRRPMTLQVVSRAADCSPPSRKGDSTGIKGCMDDVTSRHREALLSIVREHRRTLYCWGAGEPYLNQKLDEAEFEEWGPPDKLAHGS